MNKIKLNQWFIKDNKMRISLLRYYAEISILKNSDFIFYRTTIIDANRKELVFNMYTLEDAVSFVENVVAISHDNDEILHEYKKMYEENKFKSPKELKKIK